MDSWTRLSDFLGFAAAIALPFWNIPLILRIYQRKSSKDVSLWWAGGILGCLLFMLPSGLKSPDVVFRVFTITNVILFAPVVVLVMKYRKGQE